MGGWEGLIRPRLTVRCRLWLETAPTSTAERVRVKTIRVPASIDQRRSRTFLRGIPTSADIDARAIAQRVRTASRYTSQLVIPAQAGIQLSQQIAGELDPSFRWDDGLTEFLF